MKSQQHHRILRPPVLYGGLLLFVSFLWGCHHTPSSSEVVKASLCDLRERPDEFNGKLIETEGWIYSDIERFGLTEPDCGVSVMWPDVYERTDQQSTRFLKLLQEAKKNPFETNDLLFTIVQGRFETQMVRKNGKLVMNGPGYGGGAGSAPSILNVQKAVCSVLAPSSTTARVAASKRCRESM